MPKVFEERLTAITQTTFGIGALVSVVYVFASLAQLLIGVLIDRYPLKVVFIAIVALQAPVIYLAGFAENFVMFFVAIGMMFVVFGQIPGLELVQPTAIVIVGGVVASTLVTLFVIPALYLVVGSGADRQSDLGLADA